MTPTDQLCPAELSDATTREALEIVERMGEIAERSKALAAKQQALAAEYFTLCRRLQRLEYNPGATPGPPEKR